MGKARFPRTGLLLKIQLHHFRCFVAVAEELNFTKAARRLGMAQPPVSRHIRALENELGVELFERRFGKVSLTDSGSRFLSSARTVLQHADVALSNVRKDFDDALGTIRVGFGKGLGDVVSSVMNQHIRLYPSVEIDVRDVLSGFQIEALKNRKIDVAFSHGRLLAADLLSEKLFREGLTVVVARSSRLAKRSRLSMQDLAGQTLLLIHRQLSPVVHDKIAALYRASRTKLNIIPMESTCYDEAGALTIASGRGITIAVGRNPSHPSFGDRLTAVPLREPSAWIDVCIARRRDESAPAIVDFVGSTRKLLQHRSVVRDIRSSPQRPRTRVPVTE
ncbi:MAG TPA: LysR family transcriptional regulator [Candidatus Dormibacteraeota bacterium]|nr:LysR family transcriptional regulator [Candidatus Dormibacteraeota bacterium]